MTKSELIAQEWIKIVGAEQFASMVIDGDGYLNFTSTKEYHKYKNLHGNKICVKGYDPYKTGEFSHLQDIGIRPASLVNLEKNNGWTSIYSDVDLPTDEMGEYDAYDEPTEVTIRSVGASKIEHLWNANQITHFMEAKKLKKPLYH